MKFYCYIRNLISISRLYFAWWRTLFIQDGPNQDDSQLIQGFFLLSCFFTWILSTYTESRQWGGQGTGDYDVISPRREVLCCPWSCVVCICICCVFSVQLGSLSRSSVSRRHFIAWWGCRKCSLLDSSSRHFYSVEPDLQWGQAGSGPSCSPGPTWNEALAASAFVSTEASREALMLCLLSLESV